MKPFALLLIAALTLPTFPAFAGGPAAAVDDPAPVGVAPAPVLDWSGFYAGLSADRATGTINDTLTDLDFDKETTDGASPVIIGSGATSSMAAS